MSKKERGGLLARFALNPAVGSILSAVAAALIGLVIGFIILLICNPAQAFPAITTIVTGGFGLTGFIKAAARICYYSMPLIMCGLSIAFAFKTGTFNIGCSGQYLVGGFFSILTAHLLHPALGSGVWVASLIAGAVAGGLWALLPGLLNAYRNVNIIISGIMMNYIGTYMVSILIRKIDIVYNIAEAKTNAIPSDAVLPKAGLDKLLPVLGVGANLGFILVIVVGLFIWFLINRTTFGYELRTCGANREAAKYAGINEKRSIAVSMVISGALAGFGGAVVYMSNTSNFIAVSDTVPGIGFTGIAVALLGMTNPLGVILAGLFVAFLQVGGINLQIFGFVPEVVDVILAAIIFSCAFAERLGMAYSQVMNNYFTKKAGSNQTAPASPGQEPPMEARSEDPEDAEKGGAEQ